MIILNMKKNFLFCFVCVVTLLMTSCFEETGYSQTMDFARVVTINRNGTPLSFVADYTGETFKFNNLTSVEQLSLYDLQDAERAIAKIHFEVDNSYAAKWTLTSAEPIKVVSVWNKPLPENGAFGPLSALFRLQLDSWNYPTIWMAGKYLNICPMVRSLGRGTYYLHPREVFNDTLRFDMTADYTPSKESEIIDFINFDFETLTDTIEADDKTKLAVRDMLNTIAEKDSVCVMVVAEFRAKGYVNPDTIVKLPAYTNYVNLRSLVR